jgi:phosphatidylglycerophosphatase C
VSSEPQTGNTADTVAAFDFDGTLSTRDNFVPFLRRVAGTTAVTRAMATSSARLARSPRSTWSRDEVKALVLHDLFAGYDGDALDEIGRGFAFEIIQRHLAPEMVQRADWHRTQGHALVIVSASLGVYLRPVAEHLRFDSVLCTELEVGADGVLTGEMAGPNVRGAEKARRLDVWMGDDDMFVWGYGDSSGDRELWARADRAVKVKKGRAVGKP